MATQTLPRSEMDAYGMETSWLVSVFWNDRSVEIPAPAKRVGGTFLPNGFRQIVLKAAHRDSYSIARVDSGGDFNSIYSELDPNPQRIYIPQSGFEIATRLARDLTRQSGAGGGMPGIGVLTPDHIVGTDSDNQPIPSAAFLAALRKQQEPLANFRVSEGTSLWQKDPASVTETYRNAARWLYGEKAQQMFGWMISDAARLTKACPRCREQAQHDALGCKPCSADFARFYLDRGYTPEQIESGVPERNWLPDPFVAEDMRVILGKRKMRPGAVVREKFRDLRELDRASRGAETEEETVAAE